MASKRWPSIALVTTGAVLAGLVAAAAAFVPWLSAPQTPVETFQRDPSTPVVQLRDGRNISYGVLSADMSQQVGQPAFPSAMLD